MMLLEYYFNSNCYNNIKNYMRSIEQIYIQCKRLYDTYHHRSEGCSPRTRPVEPAVRM